MKSLIQLWKILAHECANRCCTSTTRDIKTVSSRSKHEGISFLTITLPQFGTDFQKSLDQGVVARDSFQSFCRNGEGLPAFLSGFLEQVFDRSTGVLLSEPDIDAILSIRQLTLIFGKILIPCSDARARDSISGFIQCEEEVKRCDSMLDSLDFKEFSRISQLLFRDIFAKVDKIIYDCDHIPKHGPGATADKLRGNSKYRQRTWTDRLETYFPCGEFMFPNVRYFNEHYDDVTFLDPGSEMPVKVITVPKTMKTPRIIAIEPTAMQYAQQSILELFVREIENDSLISQLIGFTDQTPNQRMAREGSLTGNLATLDLSDASDRVSNQLIRTMLSNFPHLQGAVDACRSRRADVPGHGVVRLAKYASMGSALCFPFEAMVFLTLVFLGIEKELGTQCLTRDTVRTLCKQVRIYGDDIIVPADYVHSVIHQLEHFGARVGATKSFWIGKFRESCGKEYYRGTDVSIVKFRRVFPTSRKHVPEIISLIEFRNQLYLAGYWKTVQWIDEKITRLIKYFPCVLPSSSVLGRTSFLGYKAEKMCEYLHAPLVKGYVITSRLPRDHLEGSGALLKFFLKRGTLPSVDRNHLERAGRPRAVDIKPRWAQPF